MRHRLLDEGQLCAVGEAQPDGEAGEEDPGEELRGGAYGFRVQGSGFRVLEFRVWALGFWGLGV